MKASILIVYTGGTIGMVQDADTGLLKPFDVENILTQIPKLKSVKAKIAAVSTKKTKDSAEMGIADWQEIGQIIFDNYHNHSAFIVLHGTDTMAYTTSALSFMFKNLTKPIICTGSQLPIGHVRTDALENVLTAIEIALLKKNKQPLVNEVCLFFGNKLFRGNCVTKISSQNFNAFDSPNFPPLVISNLNLEVNSSLLKAPKNDEVGFNPELKEGVFVYKMHPGVSKSQFQQVCENVNFEVLILETYGSGTLFTPDWLIEGLKKIKNQNKTVINISQCIYGGVYVLYESSKPLLEVGVIDGKRITLEAAITKSMHLLGLKKDKKDFEALFISDLAGELS